MRMPYWGLFLVVFMLVSIPSFSQEEEAPASEPKKENKDVKKANDAYETLKYTAAIELLKEAFGEVKGREANQIFSLNWESVTVISMITKMLRRTTLKRLN